MVEETKPQPKERMSLLDRLWRWWVRDDSDLPPFEHTTKDGKVIRIEHGKVLK